MGELNQWWWCYLMVCTGVREVRRGCVSEGDGMGCGACEVVRGCAPIT